jgi:hypothetical protein
MPRMDGTGPEGEGSRTGRGRGQYEENLNEKDMTRPGKRSGKRRKSGGGQGKGKRFQGGLQE